MKSNWLAFFIWIGIGLVVMTACKTGINFVAAPSYSDEGEQYWTASILHEPCELPQVPECQSVSQTSLSDVVTSDDFEIKLERIIKVSQAMMKKCTRVEVTEVTVIEGVMSVRTEGWGDPPLLKSPSEKAVAAFRAALEQSHAPKKPGIVVWDFTYNARWGNTSLHLASQEWLSRQLQRERDREDKLPKGYYMARADIHRPPGLFI